MIARFRSRKFLVLSIVLLVAGIALLVSTRAQFRWSSQYYFGRVLEAGASSFVLEQPDGNRLNIAIDAATRIKRGRSTWEEGLFPGDNVMVVGRTSEEGISAVVIRLVSPPRSNEP